MKIKMMLMSLLWPVGRRSILAANIAEGQWEGGRKTYLLDAAVTSKQLVAKPGTDADHIAVCGVSDIPKGVITDEGDIGEPVNVNLFGAARATELGVASGAIAADDFIVPGAAGAVRTLPASSGTYYIIGKALEAAADGKPVQYVPCMPTQRVV